MVLRPTPHVAMGAGPGFNPGSVTQTLIYLYEGSVKNGCYTGQDRPWQVPGDIHLPIELLSPPHISDGVLAWGLLNPEHRSPVRLPGLTPMGKAGLPGEWAGKGVR